MRTTSTSVLTEGLLIICFQTLLFKKMRFIWVSMYLARKLLIWDTIFMSPTGDESAILLGHPVSHAKV